MHKSAMAHGRLFFEAYCFNDFTGKTIVDVGAQDVNGSLREFCPVGANYIGVDFTEGRGVDILLTDPYHLPFEDSSVDIIVCSSVFEHSEFFWLLFLECMRVLKPTGLLYLNVPSNGMIHRFPIDSWRFYPDSGIALTNWAKYKSYNTSLLESFVGDKQGPITGEGMWNDFVAVFLKDEQFSSSYPYRIKNLTTQYYNGYSHNELDIPPQYAYGPDQKMIIDQKRTIKYLKKFVKIQDREIENQSSKVACQAEELTALKKSLSWRLTVPLRATKRAVMKFSPEIKSATYKPLRVLWRALPISAQKKATLKNHFQSSSKSPEIKIDIPIIKFDSTQESYVEQRINPSIDPAIKLIAFYLPQFHPFPENDQWWGKGFTEWYNVGRAEKNYLGHYQPHCPIHNGYYDLRIPSIMEEQADLAKQYGLHGFSYYFYWFAGKTLMDTPLEMMLSNPKVDIPFCLTWANENWTRRWDGLDNDVLIAQNHCLEDSTAFIRHLVRYFNDPRYICIDGKPVLIIYRANMIPNIKSTASLWREEIKKHGFPELYLVSAQSFGIQGPEQFGFDAAVEFPPHSVRTQDITSKLQITNPEFKGHIYSYENAVSSSILSVEPDYKIFRTPMLSWDNTARKQNTSNSFHNFSLLRYKQWLSAVCNNVFHSKKYATQEKIVFINAWNEWAEGTHLEPDRKYGYGYLQATYDVISNYDKTFITATDTSKFIKANEYAVVLHMHYHEVWQDIKDSLDNFKPLGFDLFVTTTNRESANLVLSDFPDAFVEFHDNRGRDIYPFIKIIERINSYAYSAVCKIHSKRTIYREDGDTLRRQLLSRLMGDTQTIQNILKRFDTDKLLGMIVPVDHLMAHDYINMKSNRDPIAYACKTLELDFKCDTFPAGSMFWFKPEALRDLNRFASSDFDIEHGLADGTLPHAIERVFCLLAKRAGYAIETC